jgi:hypothetical protein
MKRLRSFFVWPACLVILFLLSWSCDRGAHIAPSAGEGAAPLQTSTARISGGEFSRFFPDDNAGFDRAFTTEKIGFTQATLEKDGRTVATITVSDIAVDGDALAKYENASIQIGGYPAVAVGSKGTAVLVQRFQVQVQSKSDAFSADDREAWLYKFDLAGLSAMAR